jgi:hypothetical protein
LFVFQLLESYRSLTLGYMADAFGVTEDYMDSELCRYILRSIYSFVSREPDFVCKKYRRNSWTLSRNPASVSMSTVDSNPGIPQKSKMGHISKGVANSL